MGRMNRREVLLSAGAALLTAAGARSQNASQRRPATRGTASATRILILGGTGFIGPHFVREALAGGAKVTLFNRGKSRPTPMPGVETLLGDRDGQLDALKGRRWDVVIDDSGYVPRHVQLTTQLLREHAAHYLYISTISVYADLSVAGTTETAPLKQLGNPSTEEVNGETYGGLKALCEKPVAIDFRERHTIVRPTFIAGPGDETDRFTYWPWRVARGGDMLAPGTPLDPIQYIDVRDLASFVIACALETRRGVFNACTPPGFATIGDLIETSRQATGAETRVHWVDAGFLDSAGVLDGRGMPIWLPPSGPMAGAALVSSAPAVHAGLRFRPLAATVRDTLEWQRTRPPEKQQQLAAGLTVEQESQLLAKWQARTATTG
jgi:2'-hydroxyisoflavone reductase